MKIEANDTFLIAKMPLVINKVQIEPKALVVATYQGKTIKICENKKIYLFGSHKKCDFIVPSLYEF